VLVCVLPVFSLLDLYYFFALSIVSTLFFLFFFHDTATTEIYTLSLHDALPICNCGALGFGLRVGGWGKRSGDWNGAHKCVNLRLLTRPWDRTQFVAGDFGLWRGARRGA